MTSYVIIGDIHGQAGKLEQLLGQLAYERVDGVYQHPERKAVFLGDFIDRGPDNRRVLEIVRPMVERGHAHAVMGNHEFNAICYHTLHPHTRAPLRRHSEKNASQHRAFLAEYPFGHDDTRTVIEWFKTLPLFLELDVPSGIIQYARDKGQPRRPTNTERVRFVHACWDQAVIDHIAPELTPTNGLDEDFLIKASEPGTEAFQAVETLLKGPEIPLPDGYHFFDKDGNERKRTRVRWWARGATYRELAIVPEEERHAVPDLPLPEGFGQAAYPEDAPAVFFGHYWMSGEVQAQKRNAACLDYSAGKGGPLAAYLWLSRGGQPGAGGLCGDQFVTTDDLDQSIAPARAIPETELEAAYEQSKSLASIHGSDRFGCFDCLSVFERAEVDLGEGRPDCPRCGVGHVIGSAAGYPLTRTFLRSLQDYRKTRRK
jgi:hypothetical protein